MSAQRIARARWGSGCSPASACLARRVARNRLDQPSAVPGRSSSTVHCSSGACIKQRGRRLPSCRRGDDAGAWPAAAASCIARGEEGGTHATHVAHVRRYKAYFRWPHYPCYFKPGTTMASETDACASVTSAFLQVLQTLHQAEQLRSAGAVHPRSVLQVRRRRSGTEHACASLPSPALQHAYRPACSGAPPTCCRSCPPTRGAPRWWSSPLARTGACWRGGRRARGATRALAGHMSGGGGGGCSIAELSFWQRRSRQLRGQPLAAPAQGAVPRAWPLGRASAFPPFPLFAWAPPWAGCLTSSRSTT